MTQQEYIQLHRDLCDQAWRCSAAEEAVRVYGSPGKALASAFQQLAHRVTVGDGWCVHGFSLDLLALTMWLAGCRTEADAVAFCEPSRQLSIRKNTDYADPGSSADPYAIFKNFLRCEALGICNVEAGFLVRLSDKVSRCENLLARNTGPAVEDEKLIDTYRDLINYTCLLLAYIQTKKEQKT